HNADGRIKADVGVHGEYTSFPAVWELAAGYAKEHGLDYFTTTLSISPLKNAELLNSIGREMSERYGVKYLYSDFKKRNGYLRSIELSKEYSLYRQDYCGCIFSIRKNLPE
ncbi:MAG: epoxyqueuosine reductase QueH, partial [Clostridia bacterium]|nr:epoxyqueuosine reductase QueH [Clostridia bacterium]